MADMHTKGRSYLEPFCDLDGRVNHEFVVVETNHCHGGIQAQIDLFVSKKAVNVMLLFGELLCS
jgi:hypothetical protein